MLRSHIKNIIERCIVATGAHRRGSGFRADRTLILAYHNILPDPDAAPESSLHLALSRFTRQLDAVARTHDIISLENVVAEGGRRPRAVITFDDAYRGAVVHGIPELARRGMPATIFVPPGYVPDGAFWWDTIGERDGSELGVRSRGEALELCGGRAAAVESWAAEQSLRWREPSELKRVASESELAEALASHAGLMLGSHTWSHPNLARSTASDLSDEMVKPLEWLRQRYPGRVSDWLAYPYGIASAEARTAAREYGYGGALLVEGGGFDGVPPDRFAVPRLNIPAGLSDAGFELRLSGLITG